MIYALPAPNAAVPANCHGQIDSPKPPVRGQSGSIQATDGRLIDVEYHVQVLVRPARHLSSRHPANRRRADPKRHRFGRLDGGRA